MVVDAEANKEPGRPLFGVNGEVRSKKFDRADIVRDVGFGCRLRRSTQHLLGVYSLEFEILEFFLDVE